MLSFAKQPINNTAGRSCSTASRAALIALLVLGILPASEMAQPAPAPPPLTLPSPSVPVPPAEAPTASAESNAPREIASRPALRLRGQSTWDGGFSSIRKTLDLLGAEAARLGLLKDGAPLAHFIDSDDIGFTYEAFLPLVMPPTPGAVLAHGIESESTPAGRALVFAHEGAYDELDAAYEAITALLDEKGLVATGKFIEEYHLLPEKSEEPGLKLNIFVFIR